MGAYIKGPNGYIGGVGGGSEGNLPRESDFSTEAYIMVGVSRTKREEKGMLDLRALRWEELARIKEQRNLRQR